MIRWKLRVAVTVPLLVLMVAAGCRDGLSPELRGASVRIFQGSTAYDEVTIAIDSTVTLTARILDAAGNRVPNELAEWRSDRPDVATVEGGLVHARGIGTANIIARHAVGEDTARINVAAPISGVPSCTPAEAEPLGIGETRVVTGAEAARLCLPGGADYSLVIVNTGTTAAARLLTRVEATGVRPSAGPPNPYLGRREAGAGATAARFHQRLRGEVSARLERKLRAGIDGSALAFARSQPSQGEVLSFNVESSSSDGCRAESIEQIGARVRLITERAIIVEDTLNPSGGFTADDYREFGDFFDDEAWPLVTSVFGEPSDIDKNGKVFILFTKAVNQRRENSTLPAFRGVYVGGFFFNRDLFPTGGENGCAGSNVGEMFYMLVPDPEGEVTGRDALGEYPAEKFSTSKVRASTPTVLVHEFQHLVNDSRRLHVNRSMVWEETWLNEGLSHIAEELMFYERSGLTPGLNLGGQDFRDDAEAREAFAAFQWANFDRVASMLREPEKTSLMGSDILATRGAAWYFLRYAADRRGGDENSLWRALVGDSRSAGLENLAGALGIDPRDWIADWAAAVYLDDTRLDPPVEYQTRSWNFRGLYPAAASLWPSAVYSRYPLAVRTLPLVPDAVSLQGGAALYLRTGVEEGERAAIRVTVGELPAPSRLRVVVTRTG